MKHEESLKLFGKTVVLVPYKKEHVPKYHKWMEDEEILRLTESERLTLEEEFAMQRSWAEDSNKCTFIILDRVSFEVTGNEIEAMIGDTNLFFSEEESLEAEIEIMIAEKSARRKGCAAESLKLMMTFGNEKIGIQTYMAKIKDDNDSSLKLFEKLGFLEVGRTPVFNEITMKFKYT